MRNRNSRRKLLRCNKIIYVYSLPSSFLFQLRAAHIYIDMKSGHSCVDTLNFIGLMIALRLLEVNNEFETRRCR